MSSSAIISFLGENKPNLISEITSYLTDKGGEFSGVHLLHLEGYANLQWFITNQKK